MIDPKVSVLVPGRPPVSLFGEEFLDFRVLLASVAFAEPRSDVGTKLFQALHRFNRVMELLGTRCLNSTGSPLLV